MMIVYEKADNGYGFIDSGFKIDILLRWNNSKSIAHCFQYMNW